MNAQTAFAHERFWIPERVSFRYTGVLRDEGDELLPFTALSSLTLTLYDLSGGQDTVINDVVRVNILNTDRGTVDAQGNLVIQFLPTDAMILNPDRPYE